MTTDHTSSPKRTTNPHDEDEDDKPKGFDWRPFIPSMILGQIRRRLLAQLVETEDIAIAVTATTVAGSSTTTSGPARRALANTYWNRVGCAAVAGAGQAALALWLKAPTALEKRPEEKDLVAYARKYYERALLWTMARNALGFAVFFAIYEKLRSTSPSASLVSRLQRNILATILAVLGYRFSTWALIDGKLPSNAGKGRRGGNPYEGTIVRLRNSMSKAIVSVGIMDSIIGRPGW
ncbi:hypothetical protein HDU97_000520 [Phlyctochytrium planicorne]|nr:hypothetical protein HDU97_000520 [Phlyctochytrium planicorne]